MLSTPGSTVVDVMLSTARVGSGLEEIFVSLKAVAESVAFAGAEVDAEEEFPFEQAMTQQKGAKPTHTKNRRYIDDPPAA